MLSSGMWFLGLQSVYLSSVMQDDPPPTPLPPTLHVMYLTRGSTQIMCWQTHRVSLHWSCEMPLKKNSAIYSNSQSAAQRRFEIAEKANGEVSCTTTRRLRETSSLKVSRALRLWQNGSSLQNQISIVCVIHQSHFFFFYCKSFFLPNTVQRKHTPRPNGESVFSSALLDQQHLLWWLISLVREVPTLHRSQAAE